MLRKSFSQASMRKDEYQAKLGLLLLLASISVFFATGLVGYAVIRLSVQGTAWSIGDFPVSLLISTVCMIAVSSSIYQAAGAIRKERQTQLMRWLTIAIICAFAFVVFQTRGIHFLALMMDLSVGNQRTYVSASLFAIITVFHIFHVLGGLIALALIYLKAKRGEYDHEKHFSIDLCASYWRFLDVVWIIILATFVLAR